MKTRRRKSVLATGFIETQYKKGVPRTYGYPPSSLPAVKIKSMRMKHTLLVALEREGI